VNFPRLVACRTQPDLEWYTLSGRQPDTSEGNVVATAPKRHRVKIGATVDPALLKAVDDYVAQHPEFDRSKVIDEALFLWYTREQERAMREQFEAPDDVVPEEQAAWRRVRRAAAERWIQRPEPAEGE
jgi:hypothetical protein